LFGGLNSRYRILKNQNIARVSIQTLVSQYVDGWIGFSLSNIARCDDRTEVLADTHAIEGWKGPSGTGRGGQSENFAPEAQVLQEWENARHWFYLEKCAATATVQLGQTAKPSANRTFLQILAQNPILTPPKSSW
jgi:hypothetical protein